jgi:hypothetical protein
MPARSFRFVATLAAMAAIMGMDASSVPEPMQLAPFSAIDVRNGGHVVVRPGSSPRVTLLEGSRDYVRIGVNEQGVLIIDRCPSKCPSGYRIEVEVTAPAALTRVSLANGGWVSTAGNFPRQQELAATVAHGGTVDVRSIAADRVTASVQQGGRILTIPGASLLARVDNGGVIMYWGNARVDSSTRYGGVVQKGEPSERNLPLFEVGTPVMPSHRRR